MFPILADNPLDVWSSTGSKIYGDISYWNGESSTNSLGYTGYYGVLKHGSPGYISEGFFHTYQPARHRALNADYCRMEGVRYARGIAAYYEWGGEANGYIVGHVKDQSKSVSNSLYTYKSGSHDAYQPINGANVSLYDNSNTLIGTYNVDNNYNGVFVFYNVEPGDYTVIARAEGYSDYAMEVTVTANETTYPLMYLEEGNETITPEETHPNYQDLAPENVELKSEYSFTNDFASQQVPELSGKTIRRAIMRNGAFYVLALDSDNTPTVYVINPDTYTVTKTLGTSGVTMTSDGGGTGVTGYNYSLQLPLSDIAFTADGYLLACNYSLNQDDAKASGVDRGYFRVYKWENDVDGTPTGNPSQIISTTNNGFFNYGFIGYSFAVSGALDNCKIVAGSITASSGASGELRFVEIDYKNGEVSAIKDARNQSDKPFTRTTVGDQYQLNVSPLNNNRFIVDGVSGVPMELSIISDATSSSGYSVIKQNAMTGDITPTASYFKFATASIMATPKVDTNGAATGIALHNISSSFASPSEIPTGAEITPSSTTASTYATVGVNVIDNHMYMYLLDDGKISKFSVKIYEPDYQDLAPENVELKSEYSFTNDFASQQVPELSGKTIRRAIMRNGAFYVLALDSDNTPNVYVINPDTYTVTKTLGTSGVTMTSDGGGTGVTGYNYSLQLPLSDIAFTADGYLLACNYSLNQDDAKASGVDRGYFRVYKWENDVDGTPTGNPSQIISTTNNGFFNYGFIGYSFAVSGALDNCKIVAGSITASSGASGELRFVEIDYKNGEVSAIKDARNQSDKPFTRTTVGDQYQLNVSPLNNNRFIVDGVSGVPMELSIISDATSSSGYSVIKQNAMTGDITPTASYFKFATASIMATPKVDTNGAATGIALHNISSSFASPSEIPTGAEITPSSTTASTYATVGVNVIDNHMYMYLLNDGKISKFSTPLYDIPVMDETLPTDGEIYEPMGYYYCENLWVMNDNADIEFPFLNTNTRTACVHDGVVYVANSVDGATSTSPGVIYKYDADTGKYLGSMRVTTDGTTDVTGVYVVNQIGVDNYGNLWTAEYRSSFSLGAIVRVINKETGIVEYSTGYFNQTGGNNFFGNIYHMDIVGDITLQNDGCVLMMASCYGSEANNLNVARFEAKKGGTLTPAWTDETEHPHFKSFTNVNPTTATQWGIHTQLKIAIGDTEENKYAGEKFYIDGSNTYPVAYNKSGEILQSYDANNVNPRGLCEFVLTGTRFIAFTNSNDASSTTIAKLNADLSVNEELWKLADLGDYGSYACCLSKDDISSENSVYLLNYVPGVGLAMYKITSDDITGIKDVKHPEVDAPVEYYNLQGVRVTNPEKGLYIKRQGSTATKVVL